MTLKAKEEISCSFNFHDFENVFTKYSRNTHGDEDKATQATMCCQVCDYDLEASNDLNKSH